MSAAPVAKKKGLTLGAEPKKVIALGALAVVAVILFIYNSSSSDTNTSTSTPAAHPAAVPSAPLTARLRARRRLQRSSDRSTLRMQEVTLEAQQGEIDPTLRLDLLDRLKGVQPGSSHRSLFESGAEAAAAAQLLAKQVKVMPGALPTMVVSQPSSMPPPQFAQIPLKFYGYAAPSSTAGPRRGFFLDGENIIIANEGETVTGRYRIVALQPLAADVEDVVNKNRQTLPIVPEVQASAL